ncbi:MAG TPA: hypothetical protein VKZ79_12295 [Alphaproteobacteria bacterium]|nr:hypothetical protein [Alphaproteobacteria bacterium]
MIRAASMLGLIFSLSTSAHAQQVKPSCTGDSRDCMIAAAQSYLEGVVHHDGSHVLFAPDVRRTEQGRDTGQGEETLRAALGRMPAMLGYADTRFFVDERNRQVIYFTLLRLEISKPQAMLSEGGKLSQTGPVTVHLAERFRVEHGLIKEIEAIFYNQAGTSDGVSGWKGMTAEAR